MEKEVEIALVGGGPAALFMFKRLIESGLQNIGITIFERKQILGAGMPYSSDGANREHVTNVSDNEIPAIVCSVEEWLKAAPEELLARFDIHSANFNEYKVLPRLFFGEYLSAQFEMLKHQAVAAGIPVIYDTGSTVIDVKPDVKTNRLEVLLSTGAQIAFDKVIICTGHNWPKKLEGRVPGYFDSPYPPSKLHGIGAHRIAVRGSSLTAIDAIRTLARNNGSFEKKGDGKTIYTPNNQDSAFKIVMHSRNGLLPAVRFHLDDSHLGSESVLSKEEILKHKDQNDGFVSLDYIFDQNFKALIRKKDAKFYERIKSLSIEEFVAMVMDVRERVEPFTLLKAEYTEAAKSIRNQQSIYWKEALAILSFSMNFPAKYLCAEDMLRLQKTLMPLISIVIAFIPQASCEELLALHEAGHLEIVAVGNDGEIEINRAGGITYSYADAQGVEQQHDYPVFVDCIGQPHLSYADFPFETLRNSTLINPARLQFKSATAAQMEKHNGNGKIVEDTLGNQYLIVSGIAINDQFQVLDNYGAYSENIYIMAVPYIGGFNPDYSGLDFCEEASLRIIKGLENAVMS